MILGIIQASILPLVQRLVLAPRSQAKRDLRTACLALVEENILPEVVAAVGDLDQWGTGALGVIHSGNKRLHAVPLCLQKHQSAGVQQTLDNEQLSIPQVCTDVLNYWPPLLSNINLAHKAAKMRNMKCPPGFRIVRNVENRRGFIDYHANPFRTMCRIQLPHGDHEVT